MKKPACLKFFTILVLVIGHWVFVIPAAQAAAPPNPQPCKNPLDTELVNNYILGEDGKPPIPPLTGYLDVTGSDPSETPFDHKGDNFDLLPKDFSFQVDFSKLQAIFGQSNSNYLEGKFQDPTHGSQDLLGATSVDRNQFNGPGEKTQPKVLVDELRQKYVDYVYNQPQLAESANKYTDIQGQGDPKTIYDLVTSFGQPTPPSSSATDQENQAWLDGWGKYWLKIPTAWSEFYKAEIRFHYVQGDHGLDIAKIDETCPPHFEEDVVNFVMPEFFRTTATSDQLNRQIVPRAAQSFQTHGILPGTIAAVTSVKDAFVYCWKLLSNPQQIVNEIRKTIPVTLNLLNPAKPVYAANPSPSPIPCLNVFKDSKSGQAPYCPLPQEELARLGGSASCFNKDDAFKLEKNNPNVVCTFHFSGIVHYQIDKFNTDDCRDAGGGQYTCTPKIYVVPNFRIPWLAAVWNNTLDSQKENGQTLANQENGRPGVYSFFTPGSVYSALFPTAYDQALDLLTKCYPNWPDQNGGDSAACAELNSIGNIIPCAVDQDIKNVAECLSGKLSKTLPGKENSAQNNIKQRFIGATDCNKLYVRDMALKPKALQKYLGISNECKLNL